MDKHETSKVDKGYNLICFGGFEFYFVFRLEGDKG